MSSVARNRLKFGKISWTHLLCAKMYKNGCREFDHSSTLKIQGTNFEQKSIVTFISEECNSQPESKNYDQ